MILSAACKRTRRQIAECTVGTLLFLSRPHYCVRVAPAQPPDIGDPRSAAPLGTLTTM